MNRPNTRCSWLNSRKELAKFQLQYVVAYRTENPHFSLYCADFPTSGREFRDCTLADFHYYKNDNIGLYPAGWTGFGLFGTDGFLRPISAENGVFFVQHGNFRVDSMSD